jgi:hypothetical protein
MFRAANSQSNFGLQVATAIATGVDEDYEQRVGKVL